MVDCCSQTRARVTASGRDCMSSKRQHTLVCVCVPHAYYRRHSRSRWLLQHASYTTNDQARVPQHAMRSWPHAAPTATTALQQPLPTDAPPYNYTDGQQYYTEPPTTQWYSSGTLCNECGGFILTMQRVDASQHHYTQQHTWTTAHMGAQALHVLVSAGAVQLACCHADMHRQGSGPTVQSNPMALDDGHQRGASGS